MSSLVLLYCILRYSPLFLLEEIYIAGGGPGAGEWRDGMVDLLEPGAGFVLEDAEGGVAGTQPLGAHDACPALQCLEHGRHSLAQLLGEANVVPQDRCRVTQVHIQDVVVHKLNAGRRCHQCLRSTGSIPILILLIILSIVCVLPGYFARVVMGVDVSTFADGRCGAGGDVSGIVLGGY